MNEQFRIAQATGAGNSNNASPPRIFKLTKPFADQAVVLNLGYDQKVQVDFSAIANEKITLVHVGEKLIILFDNHSTVTVEPFFDSRHDQLGNLSIQVAPGRDLSVAEFASAFPIINDPSAASAVLPAAGDSLGQNNAQASGANFSPFTVDPLPPVGTNTLAPNEDLPTFQTTPPTGFVQQPTTPPAPTISLGTLPELVLDESFLTSATNGIDGSTPDALSTVISGILPVTLNVPGGQQSLTFALSISASGVDTGLIDSQTGNHVFLFLENGVVVGREGKDAATAASGPQDFTLSVDSSGKLTLTDLRSVHQGSGEDGDISEGIHVPAGLISLTATVTDNSNQSTSASVDVGPHLTLQDDGPSIHVVLDGESEGQVLTNLVVDESNLTAVTNGIDGSIHNGINSATGWFGGIFQANSGADGVADSEHPISYALSIGASGTSGLVDAQTGEAVVLLMNGTTVEGHTAASNLLVFTLSVDSSGFVTFTVDRSVKEADRTNPDTNEGISLSDGAVTLTATITDNDGDTATTGIDIGRQVTFLDDGPSIQIVLEGEERTLPSLIVDESNLTATTNGVDGSIHNGNNTATASFGSIFLAETGADGVADPQHPISYALSIDTSKSSGLVDAQTGEDVVLTMNGTTVEGHTASSNLLVFTLEVDSDGNVTFTDNRSVKEADGTDPDTNESISLASGVVTLTATITDNDGDTADSSIDLGSRVKFLDDGPSISAGGETPSLSVDESNLTAATNGIDGSIHNGNNTATASFSGAFNAISGADGVPDSQHPISYALSIDTSKPSGLVDAQTGEDVVLSMNGTTVEGHTASSNLLVFTLAVDSDGNVTFTDNRAVKEADGTDPDTSEGISLADGVVTLTGTITDNDGDSASTSIDLGKQVTFLDDGPSISAGGETPSLSVDESNLTASTNGIDGSIHNGNNTATASFSGAFNAISGADGVPDSQHPISYALSIDTSKPSGLVDAQTGEDVVLSMNGTTVEGHTASSNLLVFTLAVDSDGNVTFTDNRAVKEADGTDPDTSEGISLADGVVTLTGTITDNDGDSASTSIDLGKQVTFLDDGPSISAGGETPSLSVDESNLTASTNGIDGSIHNGNNTATASFSGAFNAISGADGVPDSQHPISYALSIDTSKPSGLVDAQTGEDVVLSMNGTTVEGHTASSNLLVFTLAVDSDGNVTFTDNRAVKEADGTDPDTSEGISLADGVVTLTGTITDNDGDSASTSIDLGKQVTFLDDGPSISAGGETPSLSVDESNLTASTNGIDGSIHNGNNTATASFSGAFNAISGADGVPDSQHPISYALSIDTSKPSGLVDAQTGEDVVLTMNGTTVEGHTASSNLLVFTLAVDSDGNVTFTDNRAVKEADGTDPDTSEGISLADGVVTLTGTITDNDGDSASTSIDLGKQVTFLDDGPSISAGGEAPSLSVDESNLTAATNGIDGSIHNGNNTATASFSGVFNAISGADGVPDSKHPISYALSIDTSKSSGLVDAQTGEDVVLSMNGTTVEGHTASSNLLVFTLAVDSDGNVTFTDNRAVKEADGTDPDTSEGISLADGVVTLTGTITDNDGDSASTSIDLGKQVTFLDDGPSISAGGEAPSLSVDESNLTAATNGIDGSIHNGNNTATASFSGVFNAISGADGVPDSQHPISYALSIDTSKPSGLVDAQTGEDVVLTMNGTTVEGHTASSNLLVFTLAVDSDGNVTFTDNRAVKEADGTDPDTSEGISLADGVVTLTGTITDNDGDSASTSIDLGKQVTFLDDGPSISAGGETPSLSVDESNLTASTNGIDGSIHNGNNTATASFSGAFNAISGADGVPDSQHPISYALSIDTSKPSGLVDAQTGEDVVLTMNGTTVEGHTASSNLLVFTLAVDSDGNVTFTDNRAVKEADGTDPDTSEGISLADGVVTLTGTITDNDGDSASTSIDLGKQVTFLDDGPNAGTVTAATVLDDEAQTLFVGNDVPADGVANVKVATGAAGTLFAVGADGLQSISFTNPVGLKAIYKDANGLGAQETLTYATTVVAGHTILTATGATSSNVVFKLDVAPDGSYTFTVSEPLVHPTSSTTEENLGVTVGFTVTDGDGDTATGSLTVNVNDDTPNAGTVTAATVLDDEAQTLFVGNDVPADGVANVKVATGAAGTLFAVGADGLQSISFTNPVGLKAIYKDANGLGAQETLTYATTVVAGHTILTATGATSSNVVFKLDVAPDGSYTFTVSEPLVHPTSSTTEENLGVTVGFTVTDGDGDTATGSLTVNVNDDTPNAGTVTAATVLDDEAQTLFVGNDVPADGVANVKVATGAAGTLFAVGADGLQSISFTNPVGLKAIYKDANGLGAQETLTYATTVVAGHTILTATGATSSNVVFKLDVAPDGSYTFTVSEPLVHPTSSTTEENLGVTVGFTVTDGDGDTATGSLTVNVNDDTPNAGTVTAATVLDDEAQTLFVGNDVPADGVANVKVATGAAGTLFAVGADGLQSISFTNPVGLKAIYKDANGLGAQETLTYATTVVAGHTILTATGATSSNVVFKLDVAPDGSYTFTVSEPLVHPTSSTTEENLGVTVGFTVKDGDGDTATGSLTVNVNDDTPNAGTVTAATILDDEAQTLFVGNDVPADGVANVKVATGAAGTLFAVGADGLQSISFTNPVGLKAIYKDANGLGAQETLTYATTVVAGHTILTATGATSSNVVFKLDVAPDGSYTFTVSEPLVHPTSSTTEENLGVTVGFTVTDGDGDTATGSLTVNVNDDTPNAGTVTAATVLDDEAQTLFVGNDVPADGVANVKVATGAAGTLFAVGADGLQSISFTNPVGLKAIYKDANGLGAQETLTYATTVVAGHTILTATGATSSNVVFKLDVAPDGSYTFTVSEPLVHPTSSTTEENLGVTVGFTVTDGDGDTATGSLTVNVNDDTPNAGTVTAATVLDDEAQTLFVGNDVPADGVANVKVATGAAGTLFVVGADGLQSISFTNPVGLKAIYKDANGLGAQETLTYATTVVAGHTILTATGATSSNVVFKLDVAPDGSYTFTVSEPLVHPTSSTTEENLGVTVGFTVTDGDGDTATGSLTVNVNDDTPSIGAIQDAIAPFSNNTQINGTWQPQFGADGPNAIAPISVSMGANPSGLTYVITDTNTAVSGHELFKVDVKSGTTTLYSFYEYTDYNSATKSGEMFAFTDLAHTKQFFELTVGIDGTYNFHVDTNTLQQTTTFSFVSQLPNGGNGDYLTIVNGTGTFLSGNDPATVPAGTVLIDGWNSGSTSPNSHVLHKNNPGLGIDNGNLDSGETVMFRFGDLQTGVTVGIGKGNNSTNEHFLVTVWDATHTNSVTWDLVQADGTAVIVDQAHWGATGTVSGALFSTFSEVDVTNIASGAAVPDQDDKVVLTTLSYGQNTTIASTTLNFAISITDGDGDTFASTDNLTVSLIGTNASLTGTAAPEVIAASAANDTITGGTGPGDTVDYSNATSGVTVNLTAETDTVAAVVGGGASGDTIKGIENVFGSSFADTLTAQSSGSVLYAGAGSGAGTDVLNGGAGNDTLVAGLAGTDTMSGGAGNDTFVLHGNGGANVTISDFSLGDSIVVDVANLNLTINTAQAVTFNADVSGANDQTHDSAFAGSNFFFNKTTNELFYSADNTAAHAVDLAHISTGIPAANAVHVA